MELHEILDKAADLMTERGFCKRIEEDHHGRVCLVGAINLVTIGTAITMPNEDGEKAISFCGNLLYGRFSSPIGLMDRSPVYWNNMSERTEAEVVDFLREAAIAAKELEAK